MSRLINILQTSQKIIHENFELTDLNNNIAVLKFDHDLRNFGARPICLWNADLQNNAVEIPQNNGMGTVNFLILKSTYSM
jgi:hypothetical protein